MKCKEERKMPRKPSLDGKDSSLRIRMSPEQKEKLVSYAERHYQTMSNVIFQVDVLTFSSESIVKLPYNILPMDVVLSSE